MDFNTLLIAIKNQDKQQILAQIDTINTETDRQQLGLFLLGYIQAISIEPGSNNHPDTTTDANINTLIATKTSELSNQFELLLPLISKISPHFFTTTATKRIAKLVTISIKARSLVLARPNSLRLEQSFELFSNIFCDSTLQAAEIHSYFLSAYKKATSENSSLATHQYYVIDDRWINEAFSHALQTLNTSAYTFIEFFPFRLFTEISVTGQTHWQDLCSNNNSATQQFILNVLEKIKSVIDFPGATILPLIAEMGLSEIFKSVLDVYLADKSALNDLLPTLSYAIKNQFYGIVTLLLENKICLNFFKSTYKKTHFINYFKKELSTFTSEADLAAFYKRLARLYFPLIAPAGITPFSLQTLLHAIQTDNHQAAMTFLHSFSTRAEKQLAALFIDEFFEMSHSPVILILNKIQVLKKNQTNAMPWEHVLLRLISLGINLRIIDPDTAKFVIDIIPERVSSPTIKKFTRQQLIKSKTVVFEQREILLPTVYIREKDRSPADIQKEVIEIDHVQKPRNTDTKVQKHTSKDSASMPNANNSNQFQDKYKPSKITDDQRTNLSSSVLAISQTDNTAVNNSTELSFSEKEVLHGVKNRLPHLIATNLVAKHQDAELWSHDIKQAFFLAFQGKYHPCIFAFLNNVTFTETTIFYTNYNEFQSPIFYTEVSNNELTQYLVLKKILAIENGHTDTQVSIFYLAVTHRLENCLRNLLVHHCKDVIGRTMYDFTALKWALQNSYIEGVFCFLFHDANYLQYALSEHLKTLHHLFEQMISTIDSTKKLIIITSYLQCIFNDVEINNLHHLMGHKNEWHVLLIQIKLKAMILITADTIKINTEQTDEIPNNRDGIFQQTFNLIYITKTHIELCLDEQLNLLLSQRATSTTPSSATLAHSTMLTHSQLGNLYNSIKSLQQHCRQNPLENHPCQAIADLRDIQQLLRRPELGLLPLAGDLGLFEVIKYLLDHHVIPLKKQVTIALPTRHFIPPKSTFEKKIVRMPTSSLPNDKQSSDQSRNIDKEVQCNNTAASDQEITLNDLDKTFEYAVTHQYVDIIEVLCQRDNIFMYLCARRRLISIAIMVNSPTLVARFIKINCLTSDEIEVLLRNTSEQNKHRVAQALFDDKRCINILAHVLDPQLTISFISDEIKKAADIIALYKVHLKLQHTYQAILLAIDKNKSSGPSSPQRDLTTVLRSKTLEICDRKGTETPEEINYMFKILTDTENHFWIYSDYLIKKIQNTHYAHVLLKCYVIIAILQKLITASHQGALINRHLFTMIIITLKEKTLDVMRCQARSNEPIDESLDKIFALSSGIFAHWDNKMQNLALSVKMLASKQQINRSLTPLSQKIKTLRRLQDECPDNSQTSSITLGKQIAHLFKAHATKMEFAEQILQLLKLPQSDAQYNEDDLNGILPTLCENRQLRLADIIQSRACNMSNMSQADEIIGSPTTNSFPKTLSQSSHNSMSVLDDIIALPIPHSDHEKTHHFNTLIILLESGVAANLSSIDRLKELYPELCDHIEKPLPDLLLYLKQLYEHELDDFSIDDSPDDIWLKQYQETLGPPPTKDGTLGDDPHFYQKQYKQIYKDYLLIRNLQQRLNYCVEHQLLHLLYNLLMNSIDEISQKNLQNAFVTAVIMHSYAIIEILLTKVSPFLLFIPTDFEGRTLWDYLQKLPDNYKKRFSSLLLDRLRRTLEYDKISENEKDAEIQHNTSNLDNSSHQQHYLLSFLLALKATDLVKEYLNSPNHLINADDLVEACQLAMDQCNYEITHLILNSDYRRLVISKKLNYKNFENYLIDEINHCKSLSDVEKLDEKFPVYRSFASIKYNQLNIFQPIWSIYVTKLQDRKMAIQAVVSSSSRQQADQIGGRPARKP